jgi:hypothetical protein
MTEFSTWFDSVAARVFVLCATLFVVLNVAAVTLFVRKRDRGLVNRWTTRWLAANLALLGAGLGVPIAAKVVHITATAFSTSRGLTTLTDQEQENRERPPPR